MCRIKLVQQIPKVETLLGMHKRVTELMDNDLSHRQFFENSNQYHKLCASLIPIQLSVSRFIFL